MRNTLITICARGGSKGIPGKNIKIINGKPLIAYTIIFAKKLAKHINADIELSTDSAEIRIESASWGLNSNYIRPSILGSDSAGKADTISDLLNYSEKLYNKSYDFIIDLDITSPLRTVEDVLTAFENLIANAVALNIFSVNLANRNPYFNMVELDLDGYVKVVKPNSGFKSRQEAPPVYDMNASFYIYRRSFFNQSIKTATTNFSLAFVMNHVCFDLDHHIDFLFMEYLLENNLLDIEI